MDWEMKTPPWELAEVGQDAGPNISSMVGLSNFGEQRSEKNCSVDLKLGRLGDFSDQSPNKWKDSSVPVMGSPSASSKRARMPSNGSHMASCLVDGCKSDLSNCREYHRRHKVCEVHAKTPTVMVGGQQQRFCQQCSRYELVYFQKVKSSVFPFWICIFLFPPLSQYYCLFDASRHCFTSFQCFLALSIYSLLLLVVVLMLEFFSKCNIFIVLFLILCSLGFELFRIFMGSRINFDCVFLEF